MRAAWAAHTLNSTPTTTRAGRALPRITDQPVTTWYVTPRTKGCLTIGQPRRPPAVRAGQ
jgi:hypothetical protein